MHSEPVTDIGNQVFISYAWGGPLSKKEWLRDSIIRELDLYQIPVFWDRDAILPGQNGTDILTDKLLKTRPITVLCICDNDYIEAAQNADSGLSFELDLLSKIADEEGVRLIPIVVDNSCVENLPAPLAGKWYVNVSEIHQDQSSFAPVIIDVLEGATQAQIAARISELEEFYFVRSKARLYAEKNPLLVIGSTHGGVLINNQRLTPPDWMIESPQWQSRMLEDEPWASPLKGIWAWSCKAGGSTGTWALGIAICSAFFPAKRSEDDIKAITQCGLIVSESIISFVRENEVITTSGNEIVDYLLNRNDGTGIRALKQLLGSQNLQ